MATAAATARTAVVTGASSGIGRATVRRLRADGYRVIAAARRADRLRELAEATGAEPLVVDITRPDDVARLAAAAVDVDVLVNNAGGAFDLASAAESDPEVWRHTWEVNVLGTLRVTQALLPALRRSAAPAIVTVTSIAALSTYPRGGSYTSAKHAERALVESLRHDLLGSPIRVMEIAPGLVHTEEFSLNRFDGDAEAALGPYADVDSPLTADDVAETIAAVLALPRHVNVDHLVLRPVAQASATSIFRGQIFD